MKNFWTKDSKNNSHFKWYKDQLAVPENCEYIKVSLLNDDILKTKTYTIIKEMIKICIYVAASHTSLYC